LLVIFFFLRQNPLGEAVNGDEKESFIPWRVVAEESGAAHFPAG